jgi:hypothetical protein
MISFPHEKNHEHKSSLWLITLIMLYMLQVYVTKWISTDCVISLFIILLGTYFYVIWILKIVLITSPWNVLNDMIVFLAFGYCISFVVCVCVCVHPSHISLSKWKMENEKNIRWIVRTEKRCEKIKWGNNWIGGWSKATACM